MKTKTKIWLTIIGTMVVFTVIPFFILSMFNQSLKNIINYQPAAETNIDKNLEADLIFNDTLNSKIFTENIIKAIGQAQKTIEIAVYAINSTEIRDALFAAADRGVNVYMAIDVKQKSYYTNFFAHSPKNFLYKTIPDKPTRSETSYMHHKFMIIDYGEQTKKLFTGAWNWTTIQETIDPTYVLITPEEEIIKSFHQEFERIWAGNYSTKKIRLAEYKPFDKKINYRDGFVEIWFCPGVENNSIKKRTLDLISSAQEEIKIMAWQITEPEIAEMLLTKAKNNIPITIITDDFNFNSSASIFPNFIKQIKTQKIKNLTLLTDKTRSVERISNYENLNSFLHHHLLIVDNKTVLFGTNNWSNQGTYRNDENTIITDNKKLVKEFTNSFNYHFNILEEGRIEF